MQPSASVGNQLSDDDVHVKMMCMYVWVFCPFTVGFHIAVGWMVSAGYCTNVMKGNVS